MSSRPTRTLFLAALLLAVTGLATPAGAQQTRPAANVLGDGGFEMGRQSWTMDRGEKTVAKFEINADEAADGQHSALVTIGAVESWGVQFGQCIEAGQKGKTYTFAALAKSTGNPVKISLQIERHAQPYDRAAQTEAVTIAKDQWTELHVTFKVEKDFREGWFAYVACAQAQCQFRVDLVRLYEGPYVPYKDMKRQDAAQAGVRLYDTGAASAGPLEAGALEKRAAWTPVAEDKLDHAFKGDAVFLNNRLAVVLRQKGAAAEVYTLGGGGIVRQCVLRPAVAGAGDLVSVKTVANNPGEVSVEAAFKAREGKNLTLNYTLRMGQVFVQVQGGPAVSAVRVEAPCRFAVLPDFFADDIVIDATELSAARAQLPSENFLLHMIEEGGAIVMPVWSSRADDISVELSGQGAARRVAASEIPCGGKEKAWVGVLEGPGVWRRQEVVKADAGKIIALDWKAPMPALWRVDWRGADKLCASWDMLVQRPGGDFTKHGIVGTPGTVPADRKRWTTVLGTFLYPCWLDKEGRGFLQPLPSGPLRFEGPAIIYPLGRTNATPLDAYTVVDIVRATLGVGPCEYILDVEGQQSQYKGRATCANRDTLNPIYEKQQQKQKRAEIEKSLTEVMTFIRHIRDRIEGYVVFSHELAKYLGEQKQAHPELAKDMDELLALAGMVDKKVAARRDKIKTPAEAQAMIDEFRRDGLDAEGPQAVVQCKKFTAAIVDIGSNQDELVGECRWAVKVLRQRAGLLLAAEPGLADVTKEIRARTQKILRSPAGHEGAQH